MNNGVNNNNGGGGGNQLGNANFVTVQASQFNSANFIKFPFQLPPKRKRLMLNCHVEEGTDGGMAPPPRNGDHVALDLIELFLGITKHFLEPDGTGKGSGGDHDGQGKMDCTCLGDSIFICARHDAALADRSLSGGANVVGCLPGAKCLPAGKSGQGGDDDASNHAQVAMSIKRYFCKLASAFFPEAVIWCQLFVKGGAGKSGD